MLRTLPFWLALLAASPVSAEALHWQGTLSLDLLDSTLAPARIEGSDVAIAIAGGGAPGLQTLRLRGGVTGSLFALVSDPENPGVAGVAVQATLGIATLRPFGPPAPPLSAQLEERTLPLGGALRLCLLSTACTSFVEVDLTASGTRGVGIGGRVTGGGVGALRISLEAAPWTVRTAWVSVATPSSGSVAVPRFGSLHGPLSFTGSTLATGGTVQLVTPVRVRSQLGPGPGGFAVLRLRFVPEPGFLILILSGVAGLLTLGRQKTRP